MKEMTKEAYYFSHDSNASRDPKVLKLRAAYGWEGYGIFWAIIETLREQEEYRWKASDKHLLSFCFSNGEDKVNQVIDMCLDVGLLVIDDEDFIHSESLTKRMKMKEEIAEKRRAAGRKGGSSKTQANAKQKASKESKKKVNEKEKKRERHLDHVLLKDDDYKRLIQDYGQAVVDSKIEDLDNYIGSTGRNYKDHNKTLRGWLKKDAEKLPSPEEEEKNNILAFEDKKKKRAQELREFINLGKDYWRMTDEEDEFHRMQEELERIEQQL